MVEFGQGVLQAVLGQADESKPIVTSPGRGEARYRLGKNGCALLEPASAVVRVAELAIVVDLEGVDIAALQVRGDGLIETPLGVGDVAAQPEGAGLIGLQCDGARQFTVCCVDVPVHHVVQARKLDVRGGKVRIDAQGALERLKRYGPDSCIVPAVAAANETADAHLAEHEPRLRE